MVGSMSSLPPSASSLLTSTTSLPSTSSLPPSTAYSSGAGGAKISDFLIERVSSRVLSSASAARQKAYTVEELKPLMKLEIEQNTARNSSLATAVFPDSSLHFTIDVSLLNKIIEIEPRPRARSTTTRGTITHNNKARLKRNKSSGPHSRNASLLYHPPDDWSEKKMCKWLNDIGAVLERIYREENNGKEVGTYFDADGKEVVPPKRSWCHSHSSSSLDGSPIKRKPDLALWDRHSLTTQTWPKVRSLCEVTRSEFPKNKTIKETIYQKSYIMFLTQANRCFVPSLAFACDSFIFSVCDRSGAVVTQTLKVKRHPLVLLRILVGLMFGRPSSIGYDETIECDDEGKATHITAGGTKYKVEEALFKSESLSGRATRCWHVSRIDELIRNLYVIKDSWVDSRRTQNEIDTLKLIQDKGLCPGRGVPQLIHGEDVQVPCGIDSIPIFCTDYTSRRRVGDDIAENRVHRRLVLGPVGKHIASFKSLKELIGAFIDAVSTHECLWLKGILHRDISINNILLSPPANEGRRRGLLIDFDYAFVSALLGLSPPSDDESAQTASDDESVQPDSDDKITQSTTDNRAILLHRTGTLPFMSVELLLNEDTEHSEKHDLESFFYVLLYICTMYSRPGTWNEGNIKDNSHPFGQWMDESNWYQIGAARNLEFSDTLRTQLLLQHVHSYFAPLIPMLEQLCDAIYLSPGQTHRTPLIPCGTHTNVLRILAHFFDRLPDQDDSPDTEHLPTPDAEIAPTVTAPVKRILWPRSRRAAPNGSRSEQRSISHHGTDSGYGGDETLSSPHEREDDLGSGSLRRSPRSPKKRSSTQSVSGPSKRRRNASGT